MTHQDERYAKAPARRVSLGVAAVAGLTLAGLGGTLYWGLRTNTPATPAHADPSGATTAPPLPVPGPSHSASGEQVAREIPSGGTALALAAPADCEDLGRAGDIPLPDLPPTERVRGVDASTPAPWKTLRNAGFAFAFAQAAYGIGASPSFAANWAMMRRCGLHRGAYHFITPKQDGMAQARIFWNQISADPGELPPIVDVEKPVECSDECCELKCEPWIVTLRAWLAEITQAGGRQPMIYTVESFWNQCLCGTTRFGTHPLWLAGYPKFDFPEKLRFGGWTEWRFYQHAGNVRVAGGVVDLNLFHGSAREIGEWVKTTARP
jgi:lysozyme